MNRTGRSWRYLVLSKYGWPIERIHGRPINYLIRCLIHGRAIISRAEWRRREALARQKAERSYWPAGGPHGQTKGGHTQ